MPRFLPVSVSAHDAHRRAKLQQMPAPGRVREMRRKLARLVAGLPKTEAALVFTLERAKTHPEEAAEVTRLEALLSSEQKRIKAFEDALKALDEAMAAEKAVIPARCTAPATVELTGIVGHETWVCAACAASLMARYPAAKKNRWSPPPNARCDMARNTAGRVEEEQR